MDARHAHPLKLTITGLNALAVHAEEAWFCQCVWLHIGSVDRNHCDPVAGIELMAQRLAHVTTIAEQHGDKWECTRQIIDGSGVMCACVRAGRTTKRIGMPALSQIRWSFPPK